MRLLEYLIAENVDDEAFALRIGGVTKHAVKKWKYGERIPEAHRIVAIEEATSGRVTVRDWAGLMAEKAAALSEQGAAA